MYKGLPESIFYFFPVVRKNIEIQFPWSANFQYFHLHSLKEDLYGSWIKEI